MSDHIPFFLLEAVLALYPAGGGGGITGGPLWWGAVANGLKLGGELDGVLLAASGDQYETDHQVNERHTIEVAKTWIIRKTNQTDFQLTRNARYVLQITWTAKGYWHQRTYYGVTARAMKQDSVGTLQSITELTFRAQYYTQPGANSQVFTPTPPAGEVENVPFFHEAVFLPGDYFLGQYVWSAPVAGLSANAIGWAPQVTPVVLGLEVNGALTGFTLTLPVGTANTEVTGSVSLSGLTVPAGQAVRWKVVSGPADAASAAWEGAVVMQVRNG